MSEVPKSWCKVEIEHVLKPLDNGKVIQQGWSPQCEKEPAKIDEWGVLKTTAIQEGYFLPDENKKLPKSLDPRPAIEIKAGDILMTCAGPRNRCGVTSFVKETRPRLMMSGKMYRFRADQQKIDPSYLEAFLLSQDAKIAIDRMKTGINDSGLNLTHSRFLKLAIPLAPTDEQKRIVAKIEELFSELDSGTQSLKTAREQLKVYRQAVLKHAFEGKLTAPWREKNKVSSDWKPVKLEEIIKVSSGKNLTAKQMREGSYPVYGGNGINGYHDEFNVSEKKLVIGRVGVKCGVTHITEEKCWVTDNALIVDFLVNNIDMNFFEKRLGYENLNKLSASTAQPVISGSKIYSVEMLLPSLEEQRYIASAVDHFISVAEKLENTIDAELQKSDALRQSILKKAFSGQLVAQNPTDEPASLLLERIRSEKTTPKPTTKKAKEKRRAA